MHSEDALELRLTWEEAQDLLQPPPSVTPSIVTVEGHIFEEYDVCHAFFCLHNPSYMSCFHLYYLCYMSYYDLIMTNLYDGFL